MVGWLDVSDELGYSRIEICYKNPHYKSSDDFFKETKGKNQLYWKW